MLDIFLHVDKHLAAVIHQFGNYSYLILFVVIFCETGLVVTPFLPGDSLLFAAGALAAIKSFNILWLWLILVSAAIIGNTVNYFIGKIFGAQWVKNPNSKLIKKEHLDKTHQFFEKYGGKTIIITRFVPIVRTIAPFVAGMGAMSYGKFLLYNVLGGILWVSVCVFSGYFFGNLEFVKEHFSIVVLLIIFISLLPIFWEVWKHKKAYQHP
ncbi:MAG: DedA family protein [Candidatus Omnitrophica bacterium]|nr:DedA family protein [Candidatus Omnitrophota bacterium]